MDYAITVARTFNAHLTGIAFVQDVASARALFDWSLGHEHREQAGIPPSFAELFTPKLVTVLREGYRLSNFREDVQAGLTVAIVALPLLMAIAIGSGVTPDRGLYAAMVGGFLVSALGGSRFQIGGPAGAFIVLVGLTAACHGIDGVVLAAMIAGMVLVLAGYLRLLHQIHPLSGDRRFHRWHCRDHLRQSAQGFVRQHACRQGAGRVRFETQGPRPRISHDQFLGRCDRRGHD